MTRLILDLDTYGSPFFILIFVHINMFYYIMRVK